MQVWTSNAPRLLPATVPWPPRLLVAPITVAAITCYARPVPVLGGTVPLSRSWITAAMPTSTPVTA